MYLIIEKHLYEKFVIMLYFKYFSSFIGNVYLITHMKIFNRIFHDSIPLLETSLRVAM
jgi:hypothetical protein